MNFATPEDKEFAEKLLHIQGLLPAGDWDEFDQLLRLRHEMSRKPLQDTIIRLERALEFKDHDLEVERRICHGMREHLMKRIVDLEIALAVARGEA